MIGEVSPVITQCGSTNSDGLLREQEQASLLLLPAAIVKCVLDSMALLTASFKDWDTPLPKDVLAMEPLCLAFPVAAYSAAHKTLPMTLAIVSLPFEPKTLTVMRLAASVTLCLRELMVLAQWVPWLLQSVST